MQDSIIFYENMENDSMSISLTLMSASALYKLSRNLWRSAWLSQLLMLCWSSSRWRCNWDISPRSFSWKKSFWIVNDKTFYWSCSKKRPKRGNRTKVNSAVFESIMLFPHQINKRKEIDQSLFYQFDRNGVFSGAALLIVLVQIAIVSVMLRWTLKQSPTLLKENL